MKNYLVLLLLACIGLSSCESTDGPNNNTTTSKGERLFMLSQGRFQTNDARLDIWDLTTDSIISKALYPIGDAGNDLQLINGKLYAVIDGSSKIEIINPDSTNDHKSIQFPVGSTPWKIIPLSSTKALVPCLYEHPTYILNLTSNSIEDSITITDQASILEYNNVIYTADEPGAVHILDLNSKTITKSQWLNNYAVQILADSKRNSLLVATAGNFGVTSGKLYWVDPTSLIPTDSVALPSGPNMMFFAEDKVYLCYFGMAPSVVDLQSHAISTDPMLTESYYSGYYLSDKKYLVLGTAKDAQNEDVVDIFDLSTKSLKKTINAGVLPVAYAYVK